jgi:hypothetical protein
LFPFDDFFLNKFINGRLFEVMSQTARQSSQWSLIQEERDRNKPMGTHTHTHTKLCGQEQQQPAVVDSMTRPQAHTQKKGICPVNNNNIGWEAI